MTNKAHAGEILHVQLQLPAASHAASFGSFGQAMILVALRCSVCKACESN